MPEADVPEKRLVRRSFERAARGYDAGAFLQREIGGRLLSHLDPVNIDPRRMIDLGSGTGIFLEPLRTRYPRAELVGVDFALNMLAEARARIPWWQRALRANAPRLVCADAERLPLTGACAELVFSNLTLQWCRHGAVFEESARVLAMSGLLLFSTFGPDTLKELRNAF